MEKPLTPQKGKHQIVKKKVINLLDLPPCEIHHCERGCRTIFGMSHDIPQGVVKILQKHSFQPPNVVRQGSRTT